MLRLHRTPRRRPLGRWLHPKTLRLVKILRQETQKRPRLPLDIVQTGKRLIVGGRGVAVEAILPKALKRQTKPLRRIIDMPAAYLFRRPTIPTPVPAVLGRAIV